MEDYFSFSLLSSPEHHMEAYKLRYQVYCRECHFIQEADYPAEFETDGFDKHSLHFGSFDSQNRLVGSVRLILPTCERFPIEEHCFNLEVDRSLIKRQECAEISRLTISKLYRRRANDGLYYEPQTSDKVVEDQGKVFRRRQRPMAFGLYRAMYRECKRRGIFYWFALMEKSLWKLLRIHGFIFQPIGQEIDFWGTVTPYIADIRDLERNAFSKSPEFFDYFTKNLEPELKPKF